MYVVLPLLALALGIAACSMRGITKRERARDARGRFVADDPSTPDRNEAYRE